jgi:NAD(P)H-hydrate epimerase
MREETAQFLAKILDDIGKIPPLVIDADGLKLLARIKDWHKRLPPASILTPHPGEMAVLSGMSKDEIQANRVEIAEQYARQWGQVVVLKGAFTVIASPEGQAGVTPVASPALARAGTGDVLAGMIVGLLAQGIPPFEAACAGAWLHAQAGLAAARKGNPASVLAGDLIDEISSILNEIGA